jgi:tRNA pseudouridine38-40 synthase
MVRNIIGVLVAVGQGDRGVDWVPQVLAAKDRSAAGLTAPPQGLSLVKIVYPDEFKLPIGAVRQVPLSSVDEGAVGAL